MVEILGTGSQTGACAIYKVNEARTLYCFYSLLINVTDTDILG